MINVTFFLLLYLSLFFFRIFFYYAVEKRDRYKKDNFINSFILQQLSLNVALYLYIVIKLLPSINKTARIKLTNKIGKIFTFALQSSNNK